MHQKSILYNIQNYSTTVRVYIYIFGTFVRVYTYIKSRIAIDVKCY